MRWVIRILFCLIPLAAPAAVPEPLDCSFPELPFVPDGAAASEDDMTTAREQVDAYLARMRGSLFCLDVVRRRLFERGTVGHLQQIDALTNSGIEEMRELATRFDAARRAFEGAAKGRGEQD